MTAGDAALIFAKKIGGVYEWNVVSVVDDTIEIVYVPIPQTFRVTVTTP